MRYRNVIWIGLVGVLAMVAQTAAMEPKDMGGWEKGSAYNQHYDANEVDTFRAVVVGFATEPPMPGMAPATVLLVKEPGGDEVIPVQICPAWFAAPDRIGVREGEQIRVRGAWAEMEGKEVVMAAKIKKGDDWEFKVRLTSDGTTFWTMTPEQLEKERQSD